MEKIGKELDELLDKSKAYQKRFKEKFEHTMYLSQCITCVINDMVFSKEFIMTPSPITVSLALSIAKKIDDGKKVNLKEELKNLKPVTITTPGSKPKQEKIIVKTETKRYPPPMTASQIMKTASNGNRTYSPPKTQKNVKR